MSRSRRTARLAALLLLGGCASKETVAPPPPPPGDGGNLSIVAVQITQGAQYPDGSIPLVRGMPAAVNVLIARSRESVVPVPVVLRLFRGRTTVRTDTVETGGVLDFTVSYSSPSAQFLIPASEVTDSLSWQVEIDPARRVADSTRTDNIRSSAAGVTLPIVTLPPLHVRFVPITLAANGGATGDVSLTNGNEYLSGARAMLPMGATTFSIASAISSLTNFGTAPDGGAPTFWQSVMQDVDIARTISTMPDAVWYGVVPLPSAYARVINGGYGYIPTVPTSTSAFTRTAMGMQIPTAFGAAFAIRTVAHELGHTFGRQHAPGCGAGAPIDTAFTGALGSISYVGHDVWNWGNGNARLAASFPATTGDVMAYCSPIWSSPYTWNAVRKWRQAAGGAVVTRTTREPAILVAGTITADGAVTLRPALEAEAIVPPSDAGGDVTIAIRDAGGALLGQRAVSSVLLDHADGARHFLAVLPAALGATAARIDAQTRSGASASVRAAPAADTIAARQLPSGMIELRTSEGHALLVRRAGTGEVLAIGWDGRAAIPTGTAVNLTVSNGVRSKRLPVALY